MGFISDNKPAIRFLLTFVIIYIGLNTLYGVFIESYLPNADPITESVSGQVVFILSGFDSPVAYHIIDGSKNVSITNSNGIVINVFEGCNGVNVFIVFISFLVAFRGPLKLTLLATATGFFIFHLMNLARVCLLYAVELHFPQYLYFFHKYLFTGIIYAVVFLLWFQWTRIVKRYPLQ